MTKTATATRPPRPRRRGWSYTAVPDPTWTIIPPGARCSRLVGDLHVRHACGDPATLQNPNGRPYCDEHAADVRHWTENGVVMQWEGVHEGECSQCHGPRSECDPRVRHPRTFNAGPKIWAAVNRMADRIADDRPCSTNEIIEQALQEFVALPSGTPVGMPGRDPGGKTRTVRISDNDWHAVEAKAAEVGMTVSEGIRVALLRFVNPKSPLVAADQPQDAEAESLRAELDELRAVVAGLRQPGHPQATTEPEEDTGERAAVLTAVRQQAAQADLDLKPASALFQSYDPEDTYTSPKVAPVPEVPAARAKKGRVKTANCDHRVRPGAWCKTCQAVKQ